jgi:hypothetical protein
MSNSFSTPNNHQCIINHQLSVADGTMCISLVLTIEEDGNLSLNIENEVSGNESNFSLSKEDVGMIGKWLEGNGIVAPLKSN